VAIFPAPIKSSNTHHDCWPDPLEFTNPPGKKSPMTSKWFHFSTFYCSHIKQELRLKHLNSSGRPSGLLGDTEDKVGWQRERQLAEIKQGLETERQTWE